MPDDHPPTYPSRHRGPVASVALAGPGAGVSGGYDGAVRTFDLRSGDSTQLGYHDHLVNAVEVDATGRLAASCSSDLTVALWDLRRPRLLWRREDHTDDVEAFTFLGRGMGASAGRDHRITIRDLRTGAPVHHLRGHDRAVLALAAADDVLISVGDDCTLRAWDARTGVPIARWGPFAAESDACAIDPVRRLAALGSEDGSIRVVSLGQGRVVAELAAHTSAVKAVSFSPEGRLLSAGYDQQLQVRSPLVAEPDRVEPTPTGLWERSVRWGRADDEILAGTFDGTVLHWSLATGVRGEIGADGAGNPCINDLADLGGRVAVVADDGIVRLAGGGAPTAVSDRSDRRALTNAVAADVSDGSILTGAHDQRLTRWRLADRSLVPVDEVDLGGGPVNSIAVTATGTAFVACYDGAVREVTRDLAVAAVHRHHDGPVKTVCLQPGGPTAASCSADGSVCLWDTTTGRLVSRLRTDGPIVNDIAFCPSGDRLAAVGRDFALTIYDLVGGRPPVVVPLGGHSAKCVAFAEEATVVVGDYWGDLVRVDLASGAVERRRVGRNGLSALLAVGGRVHAGSYDGGLFALDPVGGATEVLRLMEQGPPRRDPEPRSAAAVPTSRATEEVPA